MTSVPEPELKPGDAVRISAKFVRNDPDYGITVVEIEGKEYSVPAHAVECAK